MEKQKKVQCHWNEIRICFVCHWNEIKLLFFVLCL